MVLGIESRSTLSTTLPWYGELGGMDGKKLPSRVEGILRDFVDHVCCGLARSGRCTAG